MSPPDLVADHLHPPLPRLPGGATFGVVLAAAERARAPAVLLDLPAGLGLVTARDARRAVDCGLHDRPGALLAHRGLPTIRPSDRARDVKRLAAQRLLPALPVWDRAKQIGSVRLATADQLALAPAGDIGDLDPRLDAILRERLRVCAGAARRFGQSLYLVGGGVRDLALGRPVLDLDLMTEGEVPALAEAVALELGGVASFHPAFLTATVAFADGALDIARARREIYPEPAALPLVEPGTAVEDLARRDFTANALAYRVDAPDAAGLLDPFWGMFDLGLAETPDGRRLKGVRLRALHGLSFVDDPTRIFRGARFAARFEAAIEPVTRRAIRLGSPFIDRLSAERLRHELLLILAEPRPERALRLLHVWGALRQLAGELRADPWLMARFAAARAAFDDPIWTTAPAWAHARPEPARLDHAYLALLTWRLDEAALDAFIGRLGLAHEEAAVLRRATRIRDAQAGLAAPGLPPSGIRRRLERARSSDLLAAAVAADNPATRERIAEHQRAYRWVAPPLDGVEIMRVTGRPPGPLIGRLRQELLDARLDGKIASAEEAADWLRHHRPAAEP